MCSTILGIEKKRWAGKTWSKTKIKKQDSADNDKCNGEKKIV